MEKNNLNDISSLESRLEELKKRKRRITTSCI